MSTTEENPQEKCPPWEDWEDCGGFDDEEALMGIVPPKRMHSFPVRPWYYEKKRIGIRQPAPAGVQLGFL